MLSCERKDGVKSTISTEDDLVANPAGSPFTIGGVAERLNALVSKTRGQKWPVGSNPSASAIMPVYRIRKHCGTKGGSNYYFHADVIAKSPASAMKAAKENRIRNWRWIDRFDTAPKTYCRYEFLYRLDDGEAKNPMMPTGP